MDVLEAASLIQPAIGEGTGTWADLGAGNGTFTLALATLLGPTGNVLAVDRDAGALHSLRLSARGMSAIAKINTMRADLTQQFALPPLEGALLANALHFVTENDQAALLRRLGTLLVPGGRVIVVEYEGRRPSRWVPYPVSFARFRQLANAAGLRDSAQVGERRSLFGGIMYVAVGTKPRHERPIDE